MTLVTRIHGNSALKEVLPQQKQVSSKIYLLERNYPVGEVGDFINFPDLREIF